MIRLLSSLALSLTLPALTSAQGNGGISTIESKASMTYTINVIDPQTQIQISGLEDLDFAYNMRAGLLPEQSFEICVYISGDTAETYTLKLEADPLVENVDLQQFPYVQPYPYSFTYTEPNRNDPVSLSGTVTDTMFDQTQSGFTASKVIDCGAGGPPARLTVGLESEPVRTSLGNATAEMRFTVSPN